MSAAAPRFLGELEARLRKCTLGSLPALLNAIEGATAGDGVPLESLAARCIDAAPAGAGPILKAVEAAIIVVALERARGNKSEAARILRMDRKSFSRRATRARPGRSP